MSTDSPSSSPSDLFRPRRTRAKTTQSVVFWIFRLSSYFIIAAASYLFLKIAYEGSITLFSSKAPFVNWSFLTDRPQTLYVFQWDDDSLTDSQLQAVEEVEDDIRAEIPEKQAEFEAKLQVANREKAITKADLSGVESQIDDLKDQINDLNQQIEDVQHRLESLDSERRKIYWENQTDPELAQLQVGLDKVIVERQELFAEKAAVEKILLGATARKNELQSNLPDNLKKEYRRVIGNLEASLAWPEEGFFAEQNEKEAEINAEFDAEQEKLTTSYARRIERADEGKAALLQSDVERELAELQTEREARLAKAQSIEVGDIEYRGVYSRKVSAAGISPKTFSYSGGGIFPAIAGTVLLVVGSMIIALTLGIFSAIYLSEYAKPGTVLNLIRLSILNLAGVPSIVFGLFGLGMFVLAFEWNVSLLAGCFTLAFMVLPVIITASEESLRSIPQGFREGSLALGATKWTSIRTNVLPYALPGILTSSVLGVARVAGETAPIMFTAAYALRDNLPWEGLENPFQFFFQGVMALPYHIYVVSSKIPQNEYTERMQYGTAFVFLVIVAGIALTSILLRIRMRKKYKW